ncbi:MAG: glutathione S-transferase family protein [bacterium]|nr:glutathione S-transferase family protein [bacterium]
MKIYGWDRSGNCLKVRFVADRLGLDYEWVEVNSAELETRQDWYLKLNPVGQIPIVQFDDGRVLSQSNAILLHLARDSDLVPDDPWRLAQVHQWLFWEQYSHEPYIAVCRFLKVFKGMTDAELDPQKVERGNTALDVMDGRLAEAPWFAGDSPTVADLSLVAYTRWADEGGFDLAARPHVAEWIGRVERFLGL